MCPLHCYTFEISSLELWKNGLTDLLQFALRVNAARFLGLSERSGRILTDQRAREMYDAGYKFCGRYVALAKEAARLDPPLKTKAYFCECACACALECTSPAFDSALFLHHTVAQTRGR